jgi:hypothetical protein
MSDKTELQLIREKFNSYQRFLEELDHMEIALRTKTVYNSNSIELLQHELNSTILTYYKIIKQLEPCADSSSSSS